MAELNPGRWTAQIDGDFVVFIIGAKVRNPVKGWRALPLLGQMRNMLAELDTPLGRGRGFLGFQRHGGPFGVIVQYWRSFDDLERFARDPGDRHAKVWKAWFETAQQKNRAVAIWHEAYAVPAGQYEVVYQNVPADFGLMGAGTPLLATGRLRAARDRRGATGQAPAAPEPAPLDV